MYQVGIDIGSSAAKNRGAAGWRNMEDHGDGNRIFQQENCR